LGLAFWYEFSGMVVVYCALASCGMFAATLGPVVWVVISELFPNRIRGVAVAVAVASLWAANFVLVVTFPKLKAVLGPDGCFALYAAICVIGAVCIWCFVPETKEKSLEEIEHELCDN